MINREVDHTTDCQRGKDNNRPKRGGHHHNDRGNRQGNRRNDHGRPDDSNNTNQTGWREFDQEAHIAKQKLIKEA